MAVRAHTSHTLIDLANRLDPKGELATIVNILDETNEIIADAPYQRANGETYHRITQRGGLPFGFWRRFYKGVPNEKSTTIQRDEPIGMLEAYSEVDKALVEIAPNPKRYRRNEAAAFREGMERTFAATLIYGDAGIDTEQFTGLAPRLADASADNFADGGGSGSDLTSIYLVDWGVDKVSLIYPKSHKSAGISHEDLGEVTLFDSDNNKFQGYRDHFKIHVGLQVSDPRRSARYGNIETSGSSNIFDEDNLIELLNKMPRRGQGAVLYCNTTIFTQMDIAAKDKSNVNYTWTDAFGRPTMTFRGRPVRLVEQILNTETQVT